MNRDDFLWCEKYRPKSLDDVILSSQHKAIFTKFHEDGEIPNLLLTGRAGVGKTTIARALLETLQKDYIIINGSMNGNIDTLRTEIKSFASTVSFNGGRKYVILDEADYLNAQSTQPALRNFMEEYSQNCGFILTCNYPSKIIKELHSRCSVIDFTIPKNEKQKIASQFFQRVCFILSNEGVDFDKKVIAEVISKHFPDFRRTLNELQKYAATGKIDVGILSNLLDENFKDLMSYMKNKDFTNVRKWAAEHVDVEPNELFRKIYDESSTFLKTSSIPQAVLILADYQHKAAFVADQEINLVACLTEVMVEGDFK
jgi:DNA polymerase III delta prime subunit